MLLGEDLGSKVRNKVSNYETMKWNSCLSGIVRGHLSSRWFFFCSVWDIVAHDFTLVLHVLIGGRVDGCVHFHNESIYISTRLVLFSDGLLFICISPPPPPSFPRPANKTIPQLSSASTYTTKQTHFPMRQCSSTSSQQGQRRGAPL